MPQDKPGLLTTTAEFAVETYNALPEKDRSFPALLRRLAELGYQSVPRSSFFRWKAHSAPRPPRIKPIPIAEVRKAVISLPPTIPTPEQIAIQAPDMSGIPDELKDALGIRLLMVAKGNGLDRVEDAIVKVATSIAARAEDIAADLLKTAQESLETSKDGDVVSAKKTADPAAGAKNAVQCLVVLADAMHKIVGARTLFSHADRNFAEGKKLSGEAEKFKAEADVTRLAARADNARDITPQRPGDFDDAEAEDEALSALRDLETQ